MAGSKYNWDKIYSDTKQIISGCIENKKAVPTFLSKMHQILEKDYKQKGKAIPTKRTYVQKMRSMLLIPNTKRNIQAELYRLVGRYDKMTLQLLSDSCTISAVNNASWLFIRLQSKNTAEERYSHFYHLSHKLKEKFKNDILFISFDMDTLVILCANGSSRVKLESYFQSLKRGSYNGKGKKTEVQ